MIDFFEDIFEYHHHFNGKVADLLIEHSNKITERSIPLFSHMINAHQVWNSRILNTKSFAVWEARSLQENKDLDSLNYNDTLKILSRFDLTQTITYKNAKGEEFSNTIQQILFHVSNHHTHHRGQLISDLRQNGIEPIMTDYIFYKR